MTRRTKNRDDYQNENEHKYENEEGRNILEEIEKSLLLLHRMSQSGNNPWQDH